MKAEIINAIKNITLIVIAMLFFSWAFWSVIYNTKDITKLQKAVEEIEKRTDQNQAHICNLHREMD